MRRLTPLLRRGAKALAAPLCLCCLLALAAHDARADEVTVAGSTSGTFTTPGPLGTNTGPSLTGLQFISSTFDVTTSGGAATLNGPAANPNTPGSANVNNLGSFYLQPPPDMTIDSYNGARFSLVVTFDAPLGISGPAGQTATFTATLTGQVVNTLVDTYGVNVRFDNPVQTFTYALGDGRTGTFTLRVNDVLGITPNFPRALTGEITAAFQDPAPDPAAVPEPATVVLLGTGLAGALGAARRRRRAEGRRGAG